tara:strand:- start:2889 stop:3386 length:498 start_codon:yes stop_codon:yes gene_type:complete
MTIQGGGQLEFIKPYLPDDESALGDHKGNFEALNVRNPQRGYHYYYIRAEASSVLRFMNQGWQIVQADDPEQFGADLPDNIGLPLDGVRAYHDVLLARLPLEKYREYKADRADRRRASLEANYLAFKQTERERMDQLHPHQRPQGRDLFYHRAQHSTQEEDTPTR